MATILEYIENIDAYGTSEGVKQSWLSRMRDNAKKINESTIDPLVDEFGTKNLPVPQRKSQTIGRLKNISDKFKGKLKDFGYKVAQGEERDDPGGPDKEY